MQRAKNPGAQQTSAHSGDGDVERGEQCGWSAAAGFFAEDGIDEFEIADGDRVENERVVLLVVADAVEVAEGFEAGGFVDGWAQCALQRCWHRNRSRLRGCPRQRPPTEPAHW